jgi:hypothetical protein
MMSDWLDNYQVGLLCIAQVFFIILIMMTQRYAINYRIVSKLAKRMHSIPRSLIGDSANQYVEIEGEGTSPNKKILTSPISGTECVFWSVKVVATKNRHTRRTLYSDAPFFIKDKTGKALICPGPLSEIFLGKEYKTIHPGTKKFLKLHAEFLKPLSLLAPVANEFEFHEIAIPAGAQIYATGNILCLPGMNHQALATALNRSDLNSAQAFLSKNKISSEIKEEPSIPSVSITGNPLPSLSNVALEVLDPPTTENRCFYLYGTSSKRLFISSVTETMIDDNDAVLVYDSPPVWENVIMISIGIAGIILYNLL